MYISNKLIKKLYVYIGVFTAFVIAALSLFLIVSGKNDETDISETTESEDSIFEEVSNLEALELGLIDGDKLREEHGVQGDGTDELSETPGAVQKVSVSISLRSIQDDLKIKLENSENGRLLAGVPFVVTVKGKNGAIEYTDSDCDGIIYIPYVEAGDYTVFASDITWENAEYSATKSQIITVTDSIQYTKVDIKDEIKTEADINVAEEDTKVQDEDETTDVSAAADSDAASEGVSEDSDYDDISDDAEDLLAQLEAEDAAEQASKAAVVGASSGTLTAPAIVLDPQYVEAHSGVKGIDVSKHNGAIDWNAVKASGINFAIIRCGYRGSSSGALVVDPYYVANITGAQAAGINTGVYFFSQAVNEAEAVEEASMVLELISGYTLQMPVYIDVEKSRGRGDEISVEERTAVTAAFLNTITNAGYTAGIYSNKLWFENRINTGAFTGYKLWLAQYVDIPTYTLTRYDMWQYTSKGSVPGIGGYVDMNVLK